MRSKKSFLVLAACLLLGLQGVSAAEYNSIYDVFGIYSLNNTADMNISFQVRSCDDAACSGESFAGPDNTVSTWFTTNFQSTILWDLNAIQRGKWFQYTFHLVSYDGNYSPRVYSTSTTYDAIGTGVAKIAGYNSFGALPAFSYARDGNLQIDFNVFDTTNSRLTADINYGTTNEQGTGTPIVQDLNLVSAVCSDQDWDDNPSECSWDWNIFGIADANYYILVEVKKAGDASYYDFNASANSFLVDNTKPKVYIWVPADGSTVSEQTVTFDVNKVTGTDVNIQSIAVGINGTTSGIFDASSHCTADDGNYLCSYTETGITEGSNTLDVNAGDLVGNTADTNTSTITLDTTAPTTIDNDYNNTWQNTDANIQFSCSDAVLSCKNFYYSVDDTNYQAGWGTDSNIGIVLNTDLNHKIWYWSDDSLDNNESAHLIYMAIDKTAPTTLNSHPTNQWSNVDVNINFSCSDTLAGCKNFYYGVDDANAQVAWGYDQNIGVNLSTDGNHAIWYWSDDNTTGVGDNNETPQIMHVAISKGKPTTIDNDFNNNWQNTDANIQLQCSDVNAGCKNLYYSIDDTNYTIAWGDANWGISLTTDGNHAIWYWSDNNTIGTGDNNEAAHLIYMAIDKTAPTVSISSPSNGTSQTTASVALSYSGSDATSGIAKYYVKADSGSWIDNGTSTSYTFSSQTNGSHAYYAKAEDNAGNSAETSTNITISTGGAWGILGIGPQARPTETKQILTLANEFIPLAETSIPILDLTEKQLELQQKRFATASEITLKRSIKSLAIMTPSGITGYRSVITIEVENISGKTLKGMEIIEAVPKEMAENAALIKSDTNYYTMEADPILKFQLGDMQPGEKKSFEYSFERTAGEGAVTADMFNGMKAPVALLQMQPEDKCMGVLCNDYNPCTRDYCVEGKCTYAPMQEEAKCGSGMACRQGKCVLVEQAETALVMATKADTIAIILIVGAVALGLAAQITTKKWKRKRWGWG